MATRELSGTDTVRALKDSGILNHDITLRQIVAAAHKIPGINDGSPVAWELISRDFVLRGKVGEELSQETVTALQESSVLNFDITLGQVMDAAVRLPGQGGSPVAWELITRDFVLRGMPADVAAHELAQ
jgi:hypothetical protein